MESHQNLAKVFINNSFTNSYYQPANRELFYEPESVKSTACHKPLCYVFTTKNYTGFFTELRTQTGYRSTCLQQRCQQAWSTFTLLKEHKPDHPEALLVTEDNVSFLSESMVSLTVQLQYGTVAGKVCSSLRNNLRNQRKSKSKGKKTQPNNQPCTFAHYNYKL